MKAAAAILFIFFAVYFSGCSKSSADATASGSQNGSLTRFITVGNHLYIVDNNNLLTYNISNAAKPSYVNKTNVGFAIQTIFNYQDKLFIGSANAMFIYNIANPAAPAKLSETVYFVRGKDPVVAVDSVAYSTVRNSWGSGGVLNVYNIKNLNSPVNVGAFGMQSPYGLGIKDSALYVCDAEAGIKIFSIKKPFLPAVKPGLNFNETVYDVIIDGNILVCYIKGGIAFFDATNIFAPSFISKIKG